MKKVFKSISKEKYSVVVVNFRTYKKTLQTIKSLLKYSHGISKILIVDNSDNNESFEFFKVYFKRNKLIEIYKTDKNLGYAKAVNIGIDFFFKEKSYFCLVTNNDIIFKNDPIKFIRKNFSNSKVAIVGPMIFNSSGGVQHSTRLKKPSFFNFSLFNKKINEAKVKKSRIVYSVSGCAFFIDIDKFKKLNLFDPKTFLYNEENIISHVLYLNNYLTIFDPNWKIIHDHGFTSGNNNMYVNYHFVKSSIYYWSFYRGKSKISIFSLIILLTIKWIIKSAFVNSMRKGWKFYIREVTRKNFINDNLL
jgi:GT2 family glycosyltransferase